MVNSQVVAEIVEALKLDNTVDKVPSPIPVIEVNPRIVKSGFGKSANSTTSGDNIISSAALGTNVADVYLTSVNIAVAKDATCDVSAGGLIFYCTPADVGIATATASLAVLSLTAQSSNLSMVFEHPIKLARNSQIYLIGTFSAGNMARTLSVAGYRDFIN